MSKILHMLATLLIIGGVSGGALFMVNQSTGPNIAKNNAKKLDENSKIVLPSADSFEEIIVKLAPDNGGESIDFVYYKGLDADKNLIGYIVPSEGPGFQSTIKVVMGVTPDLSTITGARFTAMETPGFGDILQNDVFFGQFTEHCTNGEKQVTKTIAKPDVRPDDPNIETKSGATVSQWAAIRIVNEGLAKVKAAIAQETKSGTNKKDDCQETLEVQPPCCGEEKDCTEEEKTNCQDNKEVK